MVCGRRCGVVVRVMKGIRGIRGLWLVFGFLFTIVGFVGVYVY